MANGVKPAMMFVFAVVANLKLHWRVKMAMGAALSAMVALGAGCVVAFVVAQLGYPDQQVPAFSVGVLVAMLARHAVVGSNAQMGAFAWLLLSAGAYLLMGHGWASLTGGAFFVLLGSWLLVAHLT
jgi:predicted tellurium resistance membrane protein TerC